MAVSRALQLGLDTTLLIDIFKVWKTSLINFESSIPFSVRHTALENVVFLASKLFNNSILS